MSYGNSFKWKMDGDIGVVTIDVAGEAIEYMDSSGHRRILCPAGRH